MTNTLSKREQAWTIEGSVSQRDNPIGYFVEKMPPCHPTNWRTLSIPVFRNGVPAGCLGEFATSDLALV